MYDTRSGKLIGSLPVGLYATPVFSHDNRWLATSPNGVQVWDTGDWRTHANVHARGTSANALGIAFSPDSRV